MSAISEKLKEIGYKPFVSTDQYESTSLAKLSEIIGHQVPEDYLQFLAEFPNTGVISTDIVCSGIASSPWAPSGSYAISILYASCSNTSYDLINRRRNPYDAWDFGEEFLVIGDDVGGNLFCLDLKKESFGKIYFWDHEHMETETGFYLVANDFTSFISSLRRE